MDIFIQLITGEGITAKYLYFIVVLILIVKFTDFSYQLYVQGIVVSKPYGKPGIGSKYTGLWLPVTKEGFFIVAYLLFQSCGFCSCLFCKAVKLFDIDLNTNPMIPSICILPVLNLSKFF